MQQKSSFLKTFEASLNKLLITCTFFVFLWGFLWGLLGDEAHIGGSVFSLVVLVVLSYSAGVVLSLINLPPLLGMLLMGLILRNSSWSTIAGEIRSDHALAVRTVALTIILLRGGLEIDPAVLNKLRGICARLATLPCLLEIAAITVTSHFVLGFPWLWGVLLGDGFS